MGRRYIPGPVAALLVVALLAACSNRADEDAAPGGDPVYNEAVQLLARLESETLDSDYEDSRFDRVLVLLGGITIESPRWSAAQERIQEIEGARKAAVRRRAEVREMVHSLSTRDGTITGQAEPQTPEDLHRKLVASLGDGQRRREPRGAGRYMLTRQQRLERARSRVTNIEQHIKNLERDLRRTCGGVSVSASPGSHRDRPDCVARRNNLERIKTDLVDAERELDLLEGR